MQASKHPTSMPACLFSSSFTTRPVWAKVTALVIPYIHGITCILWSSLRKHVPMAPFNKALFVCTEPDKSPKTKP